MSKFIEHIHIKNFKSIKSSNIEGCKRINLFIGRPNVGKSNILEALSIFSLPFLKENKSKSIANLIRLENETELFYSGNIDEAIAIETNIGTSKLYYNKNEGIKISIDTATGKGDYTIDEKLNLRWKKNGNYNPTIKKYTFTPQTSFKRAHSRYLIPPFGYNLLNVIEGHKSLKEDVSLLFKEYNLSLVFDKASQALKIMQPEKKDIFLIPYNSIADTLQRIIFFKAAITSNNDSILLFEEPEAHSFPPYITHITQEMIYKKDNQFFIATHSPFILNDLLENGRDELSVFVVDYKKNETKIKKLSETELHEIYQNGVDLFTNNETYL